MNDYDKDIGSLYLEYLDANNLHGWEMSQKLPVEGFECVEEDLLKFNEVYKKLWWYDENSDKGYILEVDIEYWLLMWLITKTKFNSNWIVY